MTAPRFFPSPTDDIRLPTLRDLVRPLFQYRRAMTGTFLIIMALVVLAASFASRTYEANMKILIKRDRLDPMVSSSSQTTSVETGDVGENELNSEVELLTSRDLLEQVAQASGLVAADVDTSGGGTPDARLARVVRELRGSLDVAPIRKTTLIGVTYRSKDPRMAARVLEQLSTLYLAKHIAVHRPPGARQFFEDQTARLTADLHAAEANLTGFDEQERVVSATGERESTMQKLSEFEATLEQVNASIADATRRISSLDGQLASTPDRHVTQVRDGGNIDIVRGLRSQILALEIKRTDLLQRFTPQYQPVIQVETELHQLQAALADAEQAPLRDETTDRNPTYEWLSGERARVRAERDALQARAGAVQRTIADYRQRASRLDGQSLEQQDLLRAVKTAEENLLLYQHKQEEARISDELDRTRIANVAVVEAPSVPQTSHSQRPMILLGGAFFAVAISMGAAYTRYATNPYFRTPDEVYRVLDVPVLASLPAAD